jgi:hypothetical protein
MWMLTLRESVGPSVECKETNCACIPKEAYINYDIEYNIKYSGAVSTETNINKVINQLYEIQTVQNKKTKHTRVEYAIVNITRIPTLTIDVAEKAKIMDIDVEYNKP